jgi:hypothetical protein
MAILKHLILAIVMMLLSNIALALTDMPVIAELQGEHNGAGFGWTLVSLDFNHDGYKDIIVLSAGWGWEYPSTPSRGKVYIYYGGPGFNSSTPPALTLEGEYPNGNGRKIGYIMNAGDVNGDSFDDLMIADSEPNDIGTARFMYYFGENTSLQAPDRIDLQHIGQIIYVISSIGDVDGDGYGDTGIGYMDSIFKYDVQWGGTFERQSVLVGEGSPSYISGMKGIGDINNDGYDDFTIGLVHSDDGGNYNIIRLYYGNAERVFSNPLVFIQTYSGISRVCKALGDLNNDGYEDFLGYADGAGMKVWFGTDNLNPAQASVILNPVYYGDEYMNGMAYGDFNNDGYDDVVGASYYERRFAVWLGNSNMDGYRDWQKPSALENFGYSVATGDFDGDDFCDIAVSAPFEEGIWPMHNFTGYVFVYGGNGQMVAGDDPLAPAAPEQIRVSLSPNPLRAGNAINCTIHCPDSAKGENMEIAIFNIKGQKLYHTNEQVLATSGFRTSIPVSTLASGLYLCKVKVGVQEKVTKFTILK